MERTLGKDYPEEMRVAFLKDNCDIVEEKGYMKRLSVEEMQDNKNSLSEIAIEINDIEEEKKEAVKKYKLLLEPLKGQRKEVLSNLKQKAVYRKENCFKFIDQEERMVGYYNAEGDLIEARPANQEELQGTIFQINRKTGTNN